MQRGCRSEGIERKLYRSADSENDSTRIIFGSPVGLVSFLSYMPNAWRQPNLRGD